MRATEHYAEAEKVLRLIASGEADTETEEDRAAAVAIAQVHATLALAGATALQSYARIGDDDAELDDWAEAAGGDRT